MNNEEEIISIISKIFWMEEELKDLRMMDPSYYEDERHTRHVKTEILKIKIKRAQKELEKLQ